ncbi:hypothetical protein ISN45_At04g039320 [Arabidopsis thaliana x Arabidopsis arenosa]|uniref:Uncharacterized protein n=1 Tax=Arabidopsis thaliana x Arabidopsis arenosa TaxID=1240361 RepID=A0A8T2E5F7_9BRAS|nr:hypothetical protein ISN45_At04g039320 [Arabidopsis thaliana x Arabidopsis arenosa]
MLSDFSDIGFSSSFRIITLADGFGSVRLARGKIDEDSSEIIVALRQTEQETSVMEDDVDDSSSTKMSPFWRIVPKITAIEMSDDPEVKE